jgi:Fe-S cluster assembly scaffold protein SufB
MLDPTAKVDAIPGLEIQTNDVKASHSASIARLSSEELFYFAARGIGDRDARRMYLTGFLGEFAGELPHSPLKDRIHRALVSKFSRPRSAARS